MAGSITLGTFSEGAVRASLAYDDGLKATTLTVINDTAEQFFLKIVGLDAAGAEDPAHKTYGKFWPAGTTDSMNLPANGGGVIQLAVNSRGKVAGFSTYTG